MTAVRGQAASTPPRAVVRTFWLLHRAAYRLTGGRFGLQRPEAGARFGTMRLSTIGRRSGQRRVVMVGYYEDGPNLVTLAMNGWAEADPAWWLNLQATPDTTVDLPDGPRAVRARIAHGEERERLWAKFRDYPGWDDIEALAARRSHPTAVVVFEPRSAAESSVRTGKHQDGRDTVDDGPEPLKFAPAAGDRRRRLRLRHLLLIPGLAIAVVASVQAQRHGISIVPLLFFGIVPDLTRLLGLGQPHGHGQLAHRAVPLFNLLHHPLPPLAAIALAVVGILPPLWLVGGLAWFGHIVIGLAIGDRLRTPAGFVRSHWIVDLQPNQRRPELRRAAQSAESAR